MLGWAFRIGIFKDTHFIIVKQIIYKKNMRGIDKKTEKNSTQWFPQHPKCYVVASIYFSSILFFKLKS